MAEKEFPFIKIDEEKSILKMNGVRMLVVPASFPAGINEGARRLVGEAAPAINFRIGRECGKLYREHMQNLLKDYGVDFKPKTVIVLLLNAIMRNMGWGGVDPEITKSKKFHMQVKLENSPSSEFAGHSTKPVCHFERGILTSMVEEVLKREVEVEEKQCRALGAEACLFEVKEKRGERK